MEPSPEPLAGRYRHYKGNEYTLVGTARHSETLEEFVVYRPEYGDRKLWVRPKAMFCENVTIDGRSVPRFERLEAQPADEPPAQGNLFADVPGNLPTEVVDTLTSAGKVRIERIISHGQASPSGFWYDQPQAEWVVVLQGAARLELADGGLLELRRGDYVLLPQHERHRVAWTTPDEPTVWLAVFFDAAS